MRVKKKEGGRGGCRTWPPILAARDEEGQYGWSWQSERREERGHIAPQSIKIILSLIRWIRAPSQYLIFSLSHLERSLTRVDERLGAILSKRGLC